MTAATLRRVHRDERGLLVGFVLRLLIALALLGVVVFEGGQIVLARVSAESAARAAARAAAETRLTLRDPNRAVRAAHEAAFEEDPSVRVVSVRFEEDGTAVVRTRARARTLLVHRISFLDHLVVQRSTQRSSPLL